MLFENDFLDNLAAKQHEKLIREILNDDKDSKKTNVRKESEIFTDESEPCLLYTSPSPRDATLSRMPSSA